MTKHRKREEWIEEILEAAADEITAVGYARLTMEAVAARTDLSKGGVYRFFANKNEIALALFTRHYRKLLEFDIDEVTSWELPIMETIYRLIYEPLDDETLRRDQRVWVELISEAVRNEQFRAERQRFHALLLDRFGILLQRIVDRDIGNLEIDFAKKLETSLLLGMALMDGLTIQGMSGTTLEEQANLVKRFVEVMVNDALGEQN